MSSHHQLLVTSYQSSCGCCEGIEKLTPLPIANRPGLSALAHRAGTHAAFLETMKARLSSLYLDVPRNALDEQGQPRIDRVYPLRDLTTRAADDAAIALLDAWATVADVLTFYQERVAHEGYLQTATERRSILELARLVGYALRPGVASTVYLAYMIDENHKEPVEIPVGARSQSVPASGELPQTFETVEKLEARAAWNTLKPRMTRPQTRASITENKNGPRVYLKGISTNLGPNDMLLIDFGLGEVDKSNLYRVVDVKPDPAADRTRVDLQPWIKPQPEPETPPALEVGQQVAALVQTYLTAKADEYKIAGTKLHADVTNVTQLLMDQIKAGMSEPEIFHTIRMNVLPELRKLPSAPVRRATRRAAADMSPTWLAEFTDALSAMTGQLFDAWAEMRASEFILGQPGLWPILFEPRFVPHPKALQPVLIDLTKPPSVPPPNDKQVVRRGERAFQTRSDTGLQIASALRRDLRDDLPVVVANTRVAPDNPIKVYALRVTARPFGHNAPPRSIIVEQFTESGRETTVRYEEWVLERPFDGYSGSAPSVIEKPHDANTISLDAEYVISPGSWIVVEMPAASATSSDTVKVVNLRDSGGRVSNESLTAYGLSGKSTRLHLGRETWFIPYDGKFSHVRKTTIHAQSEPLELVEEPIDEPIRDGQGPDGFIELDGLYTDLKSGRWLIVSGERVDITSGDPQNPEIVQGVRASEQVMLDEVIHTFEQLDGISPYGAYGYGPQPLPGERTHTYIRLVKGLEYAYKRDTVTIYGNVVKATHGETRSEPLGSGDGSKALQSFTLKQPPLTYVAAPTPAGAESTLKVYVNDVEWREADTLAGLGRTARKFITQTGDDDKTTVVFGNGREGARLPTGVENVKAIYRSGIGKPGNVKAEQISLLMTRPLGAKAVINPMRASGGADRESRDQARKNAPLAVMALDRLVSVQDYEDFARAFAGIGKAAAVLLSDGRRALVHLTIAGADDIPIDASSDLYLNLARALRQYGDPDEPLQVDVRELALLVISARVRPLPDYLWEPVETKIRARLLEAFSFERRELGQDALLSEAIATIQSVEGVAYVDVDVFGSVSEKVDDNGRRRLRTPQEIADAVKQLFDEHRASESRPASLKMQPQQRVVVNMTGADADAKQGTMRPAQIAFLAPSVPDTLILNRI